MTVEVRSTHCKHFQKKPGKQYTKQLRNCSLLMSVYQKRVLRPLHIQKAHLVTCSIIQAHWGTLMLLQNLCTRCQAGQNGTGSKGLP